MVAVIAGTTMPTSKIGILTDPSFMSTGLNRQGALIGHIFNGRLQCLRQSTLFHKQRHASYFMHHTLCFMLRAPCVFRSAPFVMPLALCFMKLGHGKKTLSVGLLIRELFAC